MTPQSQLRVCAVEYLNTVPLVWGMLHGEQQGLFDLSFALPSICADRLAHAETDIGLVPAIELSRQDLRIIRGAGIACRGPVRSILLVSKVPFSQIHTLAADAGSRTSVMLARIVLQRKYDVYPKVQAMPPRLDDMLACSDAALVIGDPALLLDPATLPYRVLDLGAEWLLLTRLPMVFAVWASRSSIAPVDPAPFLASLEHGRASLEDIVAHEHPRRGISAELARDYLTTHICFTLGEAEYQGLDLFLQYAAELPDPNHLRRVTTV